MTEAATVNVTPLDAPVCELGEGALWDDAAGRLYWVDILGRVVYWLDWPDLPGWPEVLGWPARRPDRAVNRVGSLSTSDTVGFVASRERGGLVAALRHGLVFYDPDVGTGSPVRPVETDRPGNRFNDGAVDPAGRLWFGSMDTAETAPTGSLYRLDGDGRIERVLGGLTCSNGPAWSPDGQVMYHADSPRQRVMAYDFDMAGGRLGTGRLFASDEGSTWFPDGLTVDAEGFVWSCKWDGWRVVRYAPDGSVDRVLRLPVPRPTRCAFVGTDRMVLAVTTARVGLSAGDVAAAPLSGRVLLLDPGTVGAVGQADRRYVG